MLTIKHIDPSANELVMGCTHIQYDDKPRTPTHLPEVIAFGCSGRGGPIDDHGVCRFSDGTIYLMNAHGATVARYDLSAPRDD